MKAIVKHIEYEGDKPHRITIEAEDGRRVSSIIGPEKLETEIIMLMKKLSEAIVAQETVKPIYTGDIIELDEGTGTITVSKPPPIVVPLEKEIIP